MVQWSTIEDPVWRLSWFSAHLRIALSFQHHETNDWWNDGTVTRFRSSFLHFYTEKFKKCNQDQSSPLANSWNPKQYLICRLQMLKEHISSLLLEQYIHGSWCISTATEYWKIKRHRLKFAFLIWPLKLERYGTLLISFNNLLTLTVNNDISLWCLLIET